VASGRSTATTPRISVSACRLAAEIALMKAGTASGFDRAERAAASDWIAIRLIVWPMTSCSSRAMRSRSSTTARAARSPSAASSRAARSLSSAT
jgi:hypothetical protein